MGDFLKENYRQARMELDRGPNPIRNGWLSRRPEDQLGQAGVRRRLACWGIFVAVLAMLGVFAWYLFVVSATSVTPLVQP